MNRMFAVPLLACLGGAVLAWGADPFAGTWKVNTEKSKSSTGQPGPKEEFIKIDEEGANLIMTIHGTSAAGKSYSYEYTVPKGGGHVTCTSAVPAVYFDQMKRSNEHTIDATMLRDGKVVETMHGSVSQDGKTITLAGKGTDGQGRPFEFVEIQERQ